MEYQAGVGDGVGYRRLAHGSGKHEDTAEEDEVEEHGEEDAETVTVDIPCFMSMIDPCGNVTIGKEGLDVKTPFGKKHIPGVDDLRPNVKELDRTFSMYTLWLVAACAIFWVLWTCCSPTKRQKLRKDFNDAMEGRLEEDDEDMTAEEKEAELKKRMDPESNDFIAPGNIYRLLAVVHPGVVGYERWGKLAFKAGVCAYMQIYLPSDILKNIFKEWAFNWIKTPLWFLANAFNFATMFAALGSLCNMFAGKCSQSIIVGAEANFYILTHSRPEGDASDASQEAQPLVQEEGSAREVSPAGVPEGGEALAPKAEAAVEADAPAPASKTELPKIPRWARTANEYFWCCLSMAMNIAMSTLLFLVMFMKIATFTGLMQDVALVAVSLYFIFDLDDRVMESDPKLRHMYRVEVLKQTQERESKPLWLKRVAAVAIALINLMTPVGLAMVVLISWRHRTTVGLVIGGDPF